MSQADITLPNSSGSTYRSNHNAANDAIATKFSGSTAPTSPVGFQDFVDTSVSPNVQNIHDGTQFIEVDEIDTSAHTVVRKVSAGGTGATTASGAFSNIKQVATETDAGVVEKSTSAENTGGTATDVFPDVAGVKEMIDTFSSSGGFVDVKQTVLNGPTDASGFPDFGGSTGSSTVTASGDIQATCGEGTTDRVGVATNPSWTGLTTDGTMYLYFDIDSSGVITTGSTTLSPNYQFGGSASTVSGQYTYNIQDNVSYEGNGATSDQVYRVFVGEVVVSASVVTSITWYAIKGKYDSGDFSFSEAVTYVKNHNIGTNLSSHKIDVRFKVTSANGGYTVGEYVDVIQYGVGVNGAMTYNSLSNNSARLMTRVSNYIVNTSSTSGVDVASTCGEARMFVTRGW